MADNPSEHPFPLKRLFVRRFIPAFLGFIGVLLFLVGYTARHVTETIYLDLAQRRAQTIARAVSSDAPEAWEKFMSGHSINDLKASADNLITAFSKEVREQKLQELKVYDLNRKVLFATHLDEIGTQENGSALRSVIGTENPDVATKINADGSQQYELYVPVFEDNGQLRAVFELYEPIGFLDAVLIKAAVPTLAIPGALLAALAFALYGLVSRAQNDITIRTNALNDLRRRIESFVSDTAVSAAKNTDTSGVIPSLKLTTTLLFSDIRSFTSYAEENSPENVVGFLNDLMSLQVEIVTRYGGDVDKMIGDALLVRFEGDDGGNQAILAARDILGAVKLGNYPRQIGIGVYCGEVISGAIGPENRRDFTVIGDAVNIASRLCSEAKAGEIVAAQELADSEFDAIETIHVKGRHEPLTVQRLKI
ncbi:MAG: adenylate/guanylate cyclase domain-containing protein [Rhodospirillales bacterium]|nr:adenylate/guanylate cyclase domain-containing protein [Rhodospirillales bacterium]